MTKTEQRDGDSEVVFELVERLVARGYRVMVSIEGQAFSMTLTGEPAPAEPSPSPAESAVGSNE